MAPPRKDGPRPPATDAQVSGSEVQAKKNRKKSIGGADTAEAFFANSRKPAAGVPLLRVNPAFVAPRGGTATRAALDGDEAAFDVRVSSPRLGPIRVDAPAKHAEMSEPDVVALARDQLQRLKDFRETSGYEKIRRFIPESAVAGTLRAPPTISGFFSRARLTDGQDVEHLVRLFGFDYAADGGGHLVSPFLDNLKKPMHLLPYLEAAASDVVDHVRVPLDRAVARVLTQVARRKAGDDARVAGALLAVALEVNAGGNSDAIAQQFLVDRAPCPLGKSTELLVRVGVHAPVRLASWDGQRWRLWLRVSHELPLWVKATAGERESFFKMLVESAGRP